MNPLFLKNSSKKITNRETETSKVKEARYFYCPICNDYFDESKYLREQISNEKTLWIANMITHHRHVHIKSYEKSYKNNNYNKYYHPFRHEEFRQKQNERSKRQILRKCKDYLYLHDFCREDFLQLKENEEKTIELLNKLLKK